VKVKRSASRTCALAGFLILSVAAVAARSELRGETQGDVPRQPCDTGMEGRHEESGNARKIESWVSLNGAISDTKRNGFTLQFEGGAIEVDVNDRWTGYRDRYADLDGSRVTVYGRADERFYKQARIAVGAMYIDALDTYFYSEPVSDLNVTPYLWSTTEPNAFMTLYGEVTGVDADAMSFTVDRGARKVTVDMSDMIYSPVDDAGHQYLEAGDLVSINGRLSIDLIRERTIKAADVTTLAAPQLP